MTDGNFCARKYIFQSKVSVNISIKKVKKGKKGKKSKKSEKSEKSEDGKKGGRNSTKERLK